MLLRMILFFGNAGKAFTSLCNRLIFSSPFFLQGFALFSSLLFRKPFLLSERLQDTY